MRLIQTKKGDSMKIFIVLFVLLCAMTLVAQESYTLSQICAEYAGTDDCQKIPFCYEEVIPVGCYRAPDAPAYMEGLCKMQTNDKYCKMTPSCSWKEFEEVVCKA